jgi:hypothetical protein
MDDKISDERAKRFLTLNDVVAVSPWQHKHHSSVCGDAGEQAYYVYDYS